MLILKPLEKSTNAVQKIILQTVEIKISVKCLYGTKIVGNIFTALYAE